MNKTLNKLRDQLRPEAPIISRLLTPIVRTAEGKEPMFVSWVLNVAAGFAGKYGLHLSASQLVEAAPFLLAATHWAARQMVTPLADIGVLDDDELNTVNDSTDTQSI